MSEGQGGGSQIGVAVWSEGWRADRGASEVQEAFPSLFAGPPPPRSPNPRSPHHPPAPLPPPPAPQSSCQPQGCLTPPWTGQAHSFYP